MNNIPFVPPHKHVGDVGKPGQIVNQPNVAPVSAQEKSIVASIADYTEAEKQVKAFDAGWEAGYKEGYASGVVDTLV